MCVIVCNNNTVSMAYSRVHKFNGIESDGKTLVS